MKLARLDVRFFRSFNYDYERKFRVGATPEAWEDVAQGWYPFVRVPIERDITAVVGANESGKSQLLTAVTVSLTGKPIARADFCRYSELYSVRSEEIRLPEFGAVFAFDDDDSDLVNQLGLPTSATELALYRPGADAPFLVVGGERLAITAEQVAFLEAQLPTFQDLDTDLAIPDSVSIDELAGRPRTPIHNRQRRLALWEKLVGIDSSSEPTATGTVVTSALAVGEGDAERAAESRRKAEFELARKLLIDGAGIARQSFEELRGAIAAGKEGHVEAVIGAMNSAIKENLNIQRWWSQDRDFELLVEPREQELAFVIQDRTTAKYSFAERSQGLRYFLSYFVQLTSHRINNTKPDILLLDEPDAYLSSVGQNDLLQLLQDYALPEDGGPHSQVVYVTHSPFLIDKNAPHRIRVLDKGSDDEGTRVVRDAANNRYEPLRSSLGEYVAETAFIGGKNLFVEGHADQILIAGLSAHLTHQNESTAGILDLNEVTVIAAGGADSVPYMVYLARGRDSVKPPCVALLDGDASGQEAERVLRRGEVRRRRILRDEYIVRMDTWAATVDLKLESNVAIQEIEDLLPLGLAHRAALNYLARFADLASVDAMAFTVESITAQLENHDGRVWDALHASYKQAFPDEHLEKAGLAREVVSLITNHPEVGGADLLRARIEPLLRKLAELLDEAEAEEFRNRSDDRMKRAIKSFERDYTQGIRKQQAARLLREIEIASRTSPFKGDIQAKLENIEAEFEIKDLRVPNVPRFDDFQIAIRALSVTERLAYQDDIERDPAAAVLTQPTKGASKRRNKTADKVTPRKSSRAPKSVQNG